jgi:hypothetical protein
MQYNGTPRTDAFTQGCRDIIRLLTYEAILACTVYLPPMLFMIGPAAILANRPSIIVVLHSLFGFVISTTIHRVGHRLLRALPTAPQFLHVSRRQCLPVKLTVGQFAWMLEILVAAGVFCGIAGKRFVVVDVTTGVWLFALALALYFLPVYLTKLWRDRYYPAMRSLGPTEDAINKSFPGLRAFFQR